MISNPTRNIGYFKNSFKKDSADWINFSFNSEESPVVDVAYVEKMARKYSREEDNYKIRVLGLFPADDEMDDKGYMPLISEKLLRDAFIPADTPFKARRLGVDPAAAGSDPAVWVGLNTNMIKILAEEKISTPSSGASKTLTLAKEHDIVGKYINLDSFGDGADWLPFINRAGLLVDSFRSSEPSTNKDYQNKRAEGAWKFRKFLLQGGQVVYDERWLEVLNILYRTNIRGQIQIMPKKDMKKLRIPSPNVFDSGTYCFVGKEVSAEATIDAQNEEMQRLEQIVRGNQMNRFG